jgi:hypothetical protein
MHDFRFEIQAFRLVIVFEMGSNFLHQVQNQPKERRKVFAFAAASSFTLLIFAIWVLDLNRRFAVPAEPVETTEELRGELSPFASLKRSAQAFFEGAKERIQALDESATALQGTTGEFSATATSTSGVGAKSAQYRKTATSTSILGTAKASSTRATSSPSL